MKNPTLLKAMVSREEAEELIDYLYCEKIDFISRYKDETICWFRNNELVAKWTSAYKNIMISKDFLLTNN